MSCRRNEVILTPDDDGYDAALATLDPAFLRGWALVKGPDSNAPLLIVVRGEVVEMAWCSGRMTLEDGHLVVEWYLDEIGGVTAFNTAP